MLSPPAIGSIYWWPVPIALWFWYFSAARRLSDRLTSKARKHRDTALEGRSKRALWLGVSLTVFLLAHLLVIDWARPMVAVVAWAAGYGMLTLFSIRCTIAVRDSLREYHRIVGEPIQPPENNARDVT